MQCIFLSSKKKTRRGAQCAWRRRVASLDLVFAAHPAWWPTAPPAVSLRFQISPFSRTRTYRLELTGRFPTGKTCTPIQHVCEYSKVPYSLAISTGIVGIPTCSTSTVPHHQLDCDHIPQGKMSSCFRVFPDMSGPLLCMLGARSRAHGGLPELHQPSW